MAGAYCRFCDRRCFVDRVLPDGSWWHLATCPDGMAHDRMVLGYDHTTTVNPLDTRPGAHSAKNARQAGAPDPDQSKENLMVRASLDDTLHAIVQLTHEHGLPLDGVNVATAGDVQVYTSDEDRPRWVRWLTDTAHAARISIRCWRVDDKVLLVVVSDREDVHWAITACIAAAVAAPVLADHDLQIARKHVTVSAAAAIALSEALAAAMADPFPGEVA